MKKHTGRIKHPDMVMHHGSEGHGKKDPHAHPSHHAANKEHGMPQGMSPTGGYDDEAGEPGEAMGNNCADEN